MIITWNRRQYWYGIGFIRSWHGVAGSSVTPRAVDSTTSYKPSERMRFKPSARQNFKPLLREQVQPSGYGDLI